MSSVFNVEVLHQTLLIKAADPQALTLSDVAHNH